ncbi:lipopolysaccharide biosynthesis protein [Pseudonocardia sp. KRD291]|uniref:lipopolysaccharide biosynthesis protein n=1 Tax=Pseudonocardia sp. KRD291 TaxID=2792007 RepID=UPI001C4A2E2B|nr:oligosaccharide flippase family protein [Pseudonocardia sp. KRD291]MBW0101552.1 oligosaccharide flippase family protein [Pseudonocardia sp. KRD291]
MRGLLGSLRRSRWIRSGLSKILAGSAAGQGLVLLSYPLLSRLYDPAEFGLLVVFTSVVSMIGVLSTASLEPAVLIPKTEEEAAAVAFASLVSVLVTAAATAVAAWFLGPSLAGLLGAPALAAYWWLVALTVLVIGCYLVLSEWMIRGRTYGALSRRNLFQGIGQVVTQVGLGLAGVRPLGLLLGLAVGRLMGTGGLASRGGLVRQRRPRLREVVAAVSRYRRFPLVASWSKLLNTAGLQVPFLVIAAAYGDARAGLLGLAVRVVGGPAGVIGQAVYQVFTGEASARFRGPQGDLAAFVRRSVLRLLAVGVGPAVLLVAFSPAVFGVVFGPEWVESGHLAQLLAVAYLAEFAVTPISQTLFLLELQGRQLIWDAARLVLTVGGPAVAAASGASIAVAVTVLAVAHVISYALLYVLSMSAARASDRVRRLAVHPSGAAS